MITRPSAILGPDPGKALLLPVLFVGFLGVLVTTLLVYFYTKSTVEDLALGRTTQVIGSMDRELGTHLKAITANLTLWSQEDVFHLALEESYLGLSAREAGTHRLAQRIPYGRTSQMFLVSAEGEVLIVSSSKPFDDIHVADREYFRTAMAGDIAIETVSNSKGAGLPMLVVAVPVRRPDGSPQGALIWAMTTDLFAQPVMETARIGQTGKGVLLDSNGMVLASSNPEVVQTAWPRERMVKVSQSVQSGEVVTTSADDTDIMLLARTNAPTGWIIVLESDEQEVLLPAIRLAWISGISLFVTLALVAAALAALRQTLTGLRKSEEQFSKLFFLSPEGALLIDQDTFIVLEVNETFLKCWRLERHAVVGQCATNINLLGGEQTLQNLRETALQERVAENVIIESLADANTPVVCSLSAQAMDIGGQRRLMISVRDITEQKHMQEIMIQTEKMLSIGGIAAGIAHEINNPLGIIVQASQNLLQRTRADFPKNQAVARALGLDLELMRRYMHERMLDTFLEDIRSAALRASSIIRHMLDFSRPAKSHRTQCDIKLLVERALELVANDFDLKNNYDFKRITIIKEFSPNLPLVSCTATEIEQVLLNLLRNASQAIAAVEPPMESPRITIRVEAIDRWLRIEVEDNGPGIPDEVKRRVFEPFFTTKQTGVGTGLGLSVSYFIITKGHGGMLSVDNGSSGGARFSIELPLEPAGKA